MHYYLYYFPGHALSYWQAQSGAPDSQPAQGAIADFIAVLREDDTVTVVVAGTQVVTYQASLPERLSHNKLRQAVPYALEDKLAADIEQYHFALGTQTGGGHCPVAVIKHSCMQPLIDALASTPVWVQVDRVVADYAAIPMLDDAWHVVVTDTFAICRTGHHTGFSIDKTLFRDFLPYYLDAIPEGIVKPEKLVVNGVLMPEVLPAADCFESRGITVVPAQTSPVAADAAVGMVLALFAKTLAHQSALNLAQGPYLQKQSNRGWVVALAALSGLAALLLLTPWLGAWSQAVLSKRHVLAVDKSIASLYKQAYPQATSVVSPKARIEAEIKSLGQLPQGEPFITLLHSASLVWDDTMELARLQFTNRQLQLRFTIESFEKLESLLARWQARGLSVQQNQASSKPEGIDVLVTLSQSQPAKPVNE